MCQDKLQILLKLIVRCHVGGAYVPGKCSRVTQFSIPLHSYFLLSIDFFLKSVKVILRMQSKEILLVMTFVMTSHCYQRRIDSHCYCPPTKLRKGNVFSRVCLSVQKGSPLDHYS